MITNDIPKDVRDFAIAHKISLGRYGQGYAAEGHYYIRDQGEQPNILAVSKYTTSNSAFVMMRQHIRKAKFKPKPTITIAKIAFEANLMSEKELNVWLLEAYKSEMIELGVFLEYLSRTQSDIFKCLRDDV